MSLREQEARKCEVTAMRKWHQTEELNTHLTSMVQAFQEEFGFLQEEGSSSSVKRNSYFPEEGGSSGKLGESSGSTAGKLLGESSVSTGLGSTSASTGLGSSAFSAVLGLQDGEEEREERGKKNN